MYLVELINAYFEFHPHASKENEVMLKCPFCVGHTTNQDRYTLGINTATEIGHCHRCDWRAGGKNLYTQLADEANVHEDYQTDNSLEQQELVKEKRTKFSLKRIALPKEFEPLWDTSLDRLGKRAKKYLTDRGITDGQIRRHKIGFCGAGKYSYRIILPICYRNACVGFTARTFANGDPKYLISDGEKFLYSYPRERRTRCILVEGPFDVLCIEKHIRDYDCIGRQGSALTELQLHALSKYEEIAIWCDPDAPGVEGGIKIAKILKDETDVKLFGVPINTKTFPCTLR